jgi:hypothetical protein
MEAPVMNMAVTGSDTVIAVLQNRGSETSRVGTHSLLESRWRVLLRLSSQATALAVSPSKQYVATFERHTMHILRLLAHEPHCIRIKIAHTKPFTVRLP